MGRGLLARVRRGVARRDARSASRAVDWAQALVCPISRGRPERAAFMGHSGGHGRLTSLLQTLGASHNPRSPRTSRGYGTLGRSSAARERASTLGLSHNRRSPRTSRGYGTRVGSSLTNSTHIAAMSPDFVTFAQRCARIAARRLLAVTNSTHIAAMSPDFVSLRRAVRSHDRAAPPRSDELAPHCCDVPRLRHCSRGGGLASPSRSPSQ